MTIKEFKLALQEMDALSFRLPNGELIPAHFHITEVGVVAKHFIDCGGTVRQERKATLQLWYAQDVEHRLHAQKVLDIIAKSEQFIDLQNTEIEVEYQGQTIEKYGLSKSLNQFLLQPLFTDCLAQDACGIPAEKRKVALQDLGTNTGSCCTPGGGCC